MNIAAIIKGALITVGATIGTLIGGFDMGMQVLLFAVIADYITGVLAAGAEGKISSKVAFKCIPKKLMIFVIVALAVQLDRIMGNTNTVRMAAIFYYVGMEGISIVENASRTGLPIPKVLIQALEQIKGEEGE